MSLLSSFLRYNFWIHDFFSGSKVRRHYNELKRLNGNLSAIESAQDRNLRELLDYSVHESKFYSECDPSDLSSFPVVNKTVLIKNYDQILVPKNRNPWQDSESEYHIQKTSGSTGTPFAVPQDTRKRYRRIAELKYFGDIVGFKSHEKLIQLRIWTKWQKKSAKQSFWENIIPFDISNLSDIVLKNLCDIINKTKAKCLRGYASSFDILAKFCINNNIKLPSVKIIIAGSEPLYDSTRALVLNGIGCNIISQYANEENGILAQERLNEPGKFHLNHLGYIFEVLKLDKDESAAYGELGRLVITDLYNYAFPMIRYENGDCCILELDQNTGLPYISKLFGRKLDLIYSTIGEPVFPMVLARTLKNYDGINQWQFIQKTVDTYTLKLNCNDANLFNQTAVHEIIPYLKSVLGNNAVITIEYVDEIPVLNSGKRKSVVNLYMNSKLR